jgi:hypothetical protein
MGFQLFPDTLLWGILVPVRESVQQERVASEMWAASCLGAEWVDTHFKPLYNGLGLPRYLGQNRHRATRHFLNDTPLFLAVEVDCDVK